MWKMFRGGVGGGGYKAGAEIVERGDEMRRLKEVLYFKHRGSFSKAVGIVNDPREAGLGESDEFFVLENGEYVSTDEWQNGLTEEEYEREMAELERNMDIFEGILEDDETKRQERVLVLPEDLEDLTE